MRRVAIFKVSKMSMHSSIKGKLIAVIGDEVSIKYIYKNLNYGVKG